MTRLFGCSNRHAIGGLTLLATVLFAVATQPRAEAQVERKPDPVIQEPSRLEVFQLKSVKAAAVIDVLRTLMGDDSGVRVAPGPDNGIIVFGTPDQMDTVKNTLAKLDQVPVDQSSIKLFSLRNSDVASAAQVIEQIVGDVTLAVDLRTNSLVVSSTDPRSLDMVELLVRSLDDTKAPDQSSLATYKLDLFWLDEADGEQAGEPVKATKTDARIAEAVVELSRQGFANINQVGHVKVAVKTGGQFKVRSNEPLGQIEIEGTLTATSTGHLELQIDLMISREDMEIARVMTDIATQPGHNVVIGIASATDSQRRSAFVIRLEK